MCKKITMTGNRHFARDGSNNMTRPSTTRSLIEDADEEVSRSSTTIQRSSYITFSSSSSHISRRSELQAIGDLPMSARYLPSEIADTTRIATATCSDSHYVGSKRKREDEAQRVALLDILDNAIAVLESSDDIFLEG